MKWTKRFTPAAVLLLAVTACAPADDDVDTMDEPAVEPGAITELAVPAELDARSDEFTAAWNQDDPAVLAAFYTEDAVVNADTMMFTGREAILRDWLTEGVQSVSNLTVSDETWEPVGQDYRSSGRFAYTATTPEGETRQTGTYEALWTRGADGQWHIQTMTTRPDAM